MAKIERMGHFTAIGMRTSVTEPDALVINTCSDNDTNLPGDILRWSWSNPTNRAYPAMYKPTPHDLIVAVSVEALWQGTKIKEEGGVPDFETLKGDWRRGKGKRPLGAWAGSDQPLITSPGEARRRIYLPAFAKQIETWLLRNPLVAGWVEIARQHKGPVYLRDFDTGRGVDRNGPMSHAWVLAVFLNTGRWPE